MTKQSASRIVTKASLKRLNQRHASHYLSRLMVLNNDLENNQPLEQTRRLLQADWQQIIQAQSHSATTEAVELLEICNRFPTAYLLLSVSLSYDDLKQWCQSALEAAQKLRLPHAQIGHFTELGLNEYRHRFYTEALAYFQEALAAIQRNNLRREDWDVDFYVATTRKALNLPSEMAFEDLLKQSQERQDFIVQLQTAVNLGDIALAEHKHADAESYYALAYNLAVQTQQFYWIAQTLYQLGQYYLSIEDWTQAQEKLAAALELTESHNDWRTQRHILVALGDLWRKHSDLGTAISYYFRAIKLSEQANDYPTYIGHFLIVVSLYTETKDYDKAQSCLEMLLQLAQAKQLVSLTAEVLYYFGNLMLITKQWPQASAYFARAKQIYRQINDEQAINDIDDKLHLIELYQQLKTLIPPQYRQEH